MKKILAMAMVALLVMTTFVGCGSNKSADNGKKMKIVTTIFPPYDFAKKIGGDKADVSLLLKPGAESHTYEPTPQDIKKIQESDIFIYTGGENDDWVKKILASMGDKKPKVLKLVDMVKTVEEEHVEGMQEEDHDHDKDKHKKGDHDKDEHKGDSHKKDKHEESEHEIDEHVWTSPKNADKIAKTIYEEMAKVDKDSKDKFEKNYKELKGQLDDLDKEIREVVKNGKRKTILFGDRFPFRYLAKEYGLKYYAAFSGCSKDAEASAQTVKFLINKVKKEKLPVVFTIEMSNGKVAKSIVEATGAKQLMLHSLHNLTEDELKASEEKVQKTTDKFIAQVDDALNKKEKELLTV